MSNLDFEEQLYLLLDNRPSLERSFNKKRRKFNKRKDLERYAKQGKGHKISRGIKNKRLKIPEIKPSDILVKLVQEPMNNNFYFLDEMLSKKEKNNLKDYNLSYQRDLDNNLEVKLYRYCYSYQVISIKDLELRNFKSAKFCSKIPLTTFETTLDKLDGYEDYFKYLKTFYSRYYIKKTDNKKYSLSKRDKAVLNLLDKTNNYNKWYNKCYIDRGRSALKIYLKKELKRNEFYEDGFLLCHPKVDSFRKREFIY